MCFGYFFELVWKTYLTLVTLKYEYVTVLGSNDIFNWRGANGSHTVKILILIYEELLYFNLEEYTWDIKIFKQTYKISPPLFILLPLAAIRLGYCTYHGVLCLSKLIDW